MKNTGVAKQKASHAPALTNRAREGLTGLAFVSIWILGFLVFTAVPLVQTFWLSLNDVKNTYQGLRTTFLGWGNYANVLLSDPDFTSAVADYLSQILVSVPIIVVYALVVALLLNTKIKGRGFFRTVFFLPVVITSGPVINQLIESGGATLPGLSSFVNVDTLSENLPGLIATPLSFLLESFVMILWYSGIQILMYLSVLQKMDRSMYEAAFIDGASAWESFWKLTLPSLSSAMIIVIVFTVIMQSIQDTNPVISKIVTDMYRTGYGYGYASATAWLFFLIMLAVLLCFCGIFLLFTRKER